MTYSILITNYRKPGTTPEQFRDGCEELVLFLKELTGEHFPLSHIRHYIQRIVRYAHQKTSSHRFPTNTTCFTLQEGPKTETNSELNPTTPATVFVGAQTDADWDCVSELIFADETAFQAYLGLMMRPDNWAKIQEAEGKVIDSAKNKIVVVGEAVVTKKD